MQFGKLGEMIASHPRLKEQSKFLLIPGPDDAGTVILNSIIQNQFVRLTCYPSQIMCNINANLMLF